jgi:hypothetical protein
VFLGSILAASFRLKELEGQLDAGRAEVTNCTDLKRVHTSKFHNAEARKWSVTLAAGGCDQYPDEMPISVGLIVALSATVQAELRANGEPRARCAARYDSTSKDDASPALRDAYASFFLTGKGQFWGSAFHVERFIDAVKEAAVKVSANHNHCSWM